ncbi:hypothetical protein N7468_008208 [Penicillium chermesinum]|uniref:Uncharacterized protein n=1 Tax=Penicillium chermesinum TaxID=63820 RepID=A0A9W9NPC1_9EURO|nr:uncharacterized protein N7468_008208 [Penicillium chermesinum]KAJ5223666.1 hypothetical protein N7468_008208 [Penicillium chermesinum]KAJ6155507.1 hypothetical protein N7470_006073 [Penicillium chermesinum]
MSHKSPSGSPEQSKDNSNAPADPAMKWGISAEPHDPNRKPGPDHPVHQIPLEKQEKMRKKGINPVLKAEMDQASKGEGGFWRKVAQTSMGGGWIK